MSEEKLQLKYVRLDTIAQWDDNLKRHDIGTIIQSIKDHGFKDPPKFEPELNNGGGGLVEGNGRDQALLFMKKNGEEPPRGIAIDQDDGMWLMPVLFGVDAESEALAEAYAIDHNNTTIMGGDVGLEDIMKLWDHGFRDKVLELANQGVFSASLPKDVVDSFGDFDWDDFNIPVKKDQRYRFVIDGLDRDAAEQYLENVGEGRVESYRVEE